MPIIRLWSHVRRIVVILNGIAIGYWRVVEQRLDVGGRIGETQSPFHRSIDMRSSKVGGICHRIQCKNREE
jgi:hypothetical protein